MAVKQLVDLFFAVALVIALVSIAAGVWHWVASWWRGNMDDDWL